MKHKTQLTAIGCIVIATSAFVAADSPSRPKTPVTAELIDLSAYAEWVPLKTLGLKASDGLRMKADIGVHRGSGTETTARSHWSNKAAGITADVPSEAALTPHLWGTIQWTTK
jgi:hypothetical protein